MILEVFSNLNDSMKTVKGDRTKELQMYLRELNTPGSSPAMSRPSAALGTTCPQLGTTCP